jgi:tyrosinase
MRVPSLLLSASLSTAAIIPRQTDNTRCTSPSKRVEWRTLGAEVQKQYIDAVLCLKTKPSGIGLDTSRYDDFPYVHTKLDTSSACLLYPFALSCLRLHGLTPRIQFTR